MFNSFKISSVFRDYSVSYKSCVESVLAETSEDDVFIIDSNVLRLYTDLAEAVTTRRVIKIEPCEKEKEYFQVGEIIKKIIDFGFTKSNRLIAIGGGVTQDITGFISSVLYRGVDWIFYPTNLLTQCDSCIGSKTSINIDNTKNLLGTFYPPAEVRIDFSFLESLAPREISSGLGEMLHYFLIEGFSDFDVLYSEIESASTDTKLLYQLIERSLMIKKKMIEMDEFDRGPRNIFNYGHSFGHALESATEFQIPHGIAVSYGMDLANVLSVDANFIDVSLRNKLRPLFELVWKNSPLPDFDLDNFMSALSKDKKNTKGGDIKVILTRGVGNMFKTSLEKSSRVKTLIDSYFSDKLYRKDI